MKQKILSLLVLLLTAATGAWATSDISRALLTVPNSWQNADNEAFFDEIGDNILECEGARLSLVEDYIEDVKLLLGH